MKLTQKDYENGRKMSEYELQAREAWKELHDPDFWGEDDNSPSDLDIDPLKDTHEFNTDANINANANINAPDEFYED